MLLLLLCVASYIRLAPHMVNMELILMASFVTTLNDKQKRVCIPRKIFEMAKLQNGDLVEITIKRVKAEPY
jgi:DNA-binding transcriptional regulator/RsmH inhibitor MraZ